MVNIVIKAFDNAMDQVDQSMSPSPYGTSCDAVREFTALPCYSVLVRGF